MDAKKIADKYTYRNEWSEKDGEYAGLCAEFPSLSFVHRQLVIEAKERGVSLNRLVSAKLAAG